MLGITFPQKQNHQPPSEFPIAFSILNRGWT